ncbi:MAG TPA: EAL domain-containing protein [Allosphingosinicella sp.]|jgi:diguanylate cyclase (GGDEF)-like protein|nr:EAL domain-containing protein [Allosphingosinicella sp.]
MFQVYACIAHEHDLRLVLVAGVICFLAALTSFAAFGQARQDSPRRPFWLGLAGLVAGVGIWSTHFVAMLAYRPSLPMGYDVPITLLSVVVAIVLCACGWWAALSRGRAAPPLAGAIIGAGIATMHYIGMAAVIVSGRIFWDSGLATASVAIGIGFAAAATALQARRPQAGSWLPALLLTVGICGMHFTAMAAASVLPDPRIEVPPSAIDQGTLATIVTAAALLLLAIGFGLVLFERSLARSQLEEAQQRAALAEEVLRGAAERETLHHSLQQHAAISSAALDNMAQGLSMYDAEDRLIIHNRRYVEIYDMPEELREPGTPISIILQHIFGSNQLPTDEAGNRVALREVELANGRTIEIQIQQLPGGGWVATHEDVTEKRAASRHIAYLAAHDVLTGLPNRATFGERLKQEAAQAKRGRGFALLTIDLDRFKEVNDTLGHPIGDEILKAVSKRLTDLVRDEDLVTRLGGDEFAILQSGIGVAADAAALANRAIEALAEPFEFEGHTVAIGASVGISLAPGDGLDADELLKMSDLALYRAKSDSRGTFRFFEEGMDSRLRERRTIENDLRAAIREGQFVVHYQPLLDLKQGRIGCFEALVRWNHPERGLVQPNDFISIAEESGLIIPIGEWVLRQACRDAATWPGDVGVAVNLSAAQFKRGDLVAMTTSALSAAGLAPARLELEITESVLLHDEAWVRTVLEKLTALGIRIAMDDFGTGYSSLSYLRSFPFAKIKIDSSFVADLVGTTDSLAIVQATIQLSRKLGMTTTAEGVETEEQLRILTEEGCAEVQGYHVSRPIPADGVAGLLELYGCSETPLRKAG